MPSKLILLCGLMAAAAPAFGSLVFTLSPGVMTGVPGAGPVVFRGTLTDTDTDNSFLFMNDVGVTFTAPGGSYLTLDPTGHPVSSPNIFFFDSVPGTMIGDGIPTDDFYSGPVFEIFLAPNTPLGRYFGSIGILGGFNGPGDADVLATQSFEVDAIPEPGAAVLSLIGLLGVAAVGWKRCARFS